MPRRSCEVNIMKRDTNVISSLFVAIGTIALDIVGTRFLQIVNYLIIIIMLNYLKALNIWISVRYIKIKSVLSIIPKAINGAVCFQLIYFSSDDFENMSTWIYHHYLIIYSSKSYKDVYYKMCMVFVCFDYNELGRFIWVIIPYVTSVIPEICDPEWSVKNRPVTNHEKIQQHAKPNNSWGVLYNDTRIHCGLVMP